MLLNTRRLKKRRHFLLEGASIDNFDMSTSEVKDTVEQLEDDLASNVPNVNAPEVSNGEIQNGGLDGKEGVDQIPTDVTAENAVIFLKESYNGNKYYVNMEDVLKIQEGAAEKESEEKAEEDPADDPNNAVSDEGAVAPEESEVEPAECDTQASDVIEQIADANGIDKSDVTVVIQAKECARIAKAALCEEAAGLNNSYNQRKLRALKAAVSDLWFNNIDMIQK